MADKPELRGAIEPTVAPPTATIGAALDEAPLSRFHRRAVVVSGMGFFTDAYDLFVISTVATLVGEQWKLTTTDTSWVTGAAILGAFVGAFSFGRLADVIGRRRVYAIVAGIMVVGAVSAAFSPNLGWLIGSRLVLGIGVGGDYPVSAVLMSEYSNRHDRGKLVGLVFSMQAVGLVVGPLVGLALLSSGVGHELTWRLLLGFGAIPASCVIYLRTKMPESPRFRAYVQGEADGAARDISAFAGGGVQVEVASSGPRRLGVTEFLRDPKMWRLMIGTAGAWFLFDYAYYGNTLSLPAILKGVDPTASLEAKLAWTLGIFVVFAVPGYVLAVLRMDRVGHRRLQAVGFLVMASAFGLLAAVGKLTTTVVPFLVIFGVSYFFVEFGPNTTTFVIPSEVFPVSMRTTGHGVAAGIGKLGAFVGVFVVPALQTRIGLRGMLAVAVGASLAGMLVTLVLPEAADRSLDEVGGDVPSLDRPAATGSDRTPQAATA